MKKLIINHILLFIVILLAVPDSSLSDPDQSFSVSAALSPAVISIQPAELLPVKFEAEYNREMNGSTYYAEFRYSSELDISIYSTYPKASRAQVNPKRSRVFLEWENLYVPEGQSFNAYLYASSAETGIYSIYPKKIYYKRNGRGKPVKVPGNEIIITVTEEPTPPLQPTDLGVLSVSTKEVKLTWNDNSFNEKGFYLERKEAIEGKFIRIADIKENTITYSDTGLDSGRKYYYRIKAYNSSGESSYSNEIYALTTAPVLFADLSSINFETLKTGQTISQILKIKNTGIGDLIINNVSSPDDPFSVIKDECSGQSLFSGEDSCFIEILFSPETEGTFSDNISIQSNDFERPNIIINLTGTAEPPLDSREICIHPAALDFGTGITGETSLLSLLIENSGNDNLSIENIAAIASPFSIISDGCSYQTLSSDTSCSVIIEFLSDKEGTYNEILTIKSNDADNPVKSVNISGNTVSYTLETIRPTDAFNPDGWSNVSSGYDGNQDTYTYKNTPYSSPSISFGGSSLDEKVNAWEDKYMYWNTAWLSIIFQKYPAVDDTTEIIATDNLGNLKHILLAADSISISKQKYVKRLDISDWGDGFSNIGDLRVRINGKRNRSSDNTQSMVYDIEIVGDTAPFIYDFTRGAYEVLPNLKTGLSTVYAPGAMDKVDSDDNIRVLQYADTNQYPVHLYKFKPDNKNVLINWTGQIAQSSSEAYAQSFVPDRSGTISRINMFFEKEGTPEGNIFIRIKSKPGGELIAESNSVSESSLSTTGSWVLFTFADPPYVNEGQIYYMEVWRDKYSSEDIPVIRLMDCEKSSSSVLRRSLGKWTAESEDMIMADIYIDDVPNSSSQNCTYNGFVKDYLYGMDCKDIYLEAYNNETSSWDRIDSSNYDASENNVTLSGFISADYFDAEGWTASRIYSPSGDNAFNLATDAIELTSLRDNLEFAIEPRSLNFGLVDINTSSYKTLSIINTGTGELRLGTISSMSPPFSLTTDECSDYSLASGNSCGLTIRFNPYTEGSFKGSLTIPSNDADYPNKIITAEGMAVSSAFSGTVTDSSTNLPVSDVSVTLIDFSGEQYSTLTDSDGVYSLKGLKRGDFEVKFTKTDYYDKKTAVSLSAGQSAVLDVQMDPVIFKITSHADGAITDTPVLDITGTVPAGSIVTVNNESTTINGNIFSVTVTLDSGLNIITAEAVDSNGQTINYTISIYYISPISLEIIEPENDQIFNTSPVTVSGAVYNTAGEGGGKEALAQSFVAGKSGVLSKISIPLFRIGSSETDNVFLRISSSIGGETIALSNKINFNNIPSISYEWVNFVFEGTDQIELTNGKDYRIEIWRESKDNSNYLSWLFGSMDYYPEGERFIRDNGSWDYPLEWGDFAFRVYIDGSVDQYQTNIGMSNYVNLYGINPYTVEATVNDSDVIVIDNSFQTSVDLQEGDNTITATAYDSYGHITSGNVRISLITNGSVSGRIIDSLSARAIEAAIVTLTDSSDMIYTTQTSAEGIYVINEIPQGAVTVNISKEGYKAKTVSGTIIPGQTVNINVVLDPVIPVITGFSVSDITADSAVINWTTDMPADSMVSYGLTTDYEFSESDSAFSTIHKITLTDLSPGTRYYFSIKSTNSYGFTSSLNNKSFTTSGPVSITIDYPPDNKKIYRQDIMVRGTVINPGNNETGVTVNGNTAVIYKGEFFVNHVSLVEDQNILTATAVDSEGNTATDTIIVDAVPKDPHIVLRANIEYGTSPLNTYFTAITSIPYTAANYTFDYEGDSTADYTGPSFDDINVIYPKEGVYFPTLEITDKQGNTYIDTIAVIVIDPSMIETLLVTKWNAMENALMAGDHASALDYFVDGSKPRYERIFNDLGTSELNTILSSIEGFKLLNHTGHMAECGLFRTEPSGTFAYPVIFVKDDNGIWKIFGF